MFINSNEINNALLVKSDFNKVKAVIKKCEEKIELDINDIAILLNASDEESLKLIHNTAYEIKDSLYGNRVVLFAPLYVSDYCTNNCSYCGYKRDNKFERTKLSKDELKEEVRLLEKLGHKRLALEVGEDEVNFSFDEVLDSIDTIYENSSIRRINVNVAATTVENFKKLKEKEIGTYILFQETYDKTAFEKFHPMSLKGNYERQLYAHHKAMEAGIEDVGGGVLFGLADYRFEVLALLLHNAELEKTHGVGFHTVSVPRLKQAEGMSLDDYPNIVSDADFKKIVSILRIAIPYAGIILSTRENIEMRRELIDLGVTQISAGSQPGVGAYSDNELRLVHNSQFDVSDDRSPIDVIKDLLKLGYLPSYCTACYRSNRVGQDFMDIVRAGKIKEICHPNALITFVEYVEDYGDEELKVLAEKLINSELDKIPSKLFKDRIEALIIRIKNGERDLYV